MRTSLSLQRKAVRERDRRRHQLRCLVGGVAEHHALVAGAAGVDAHGDVAGLLVDGRDDGAGVGVEAVECVVIADCCDSSADQALEVDVSLGRDLAGNDDQAGAGQRLARHAAVRILRQAGIENGIRDLVGDLVGMALGHRLTGEEKTLACSQNKLLQVTAVGNASAFDVTLLFYPSSRSRIKAPSHMQISAEPMVKYPH